jgi:hypothetical protein
MELLWEKAPTTDALILAHPRTNCLLAGKKFYAPGHELTEFKEDHGG